MKKKFLYFVFILWAFLFITSGAIAQNIPSIKKNKYGIQQLWVHNKPYLMLAGELYNSSASDSAYLKKLLPQLAQNNINTVLLPVTWENIEPEEGKFNFTAVKQLLYLARQNHLKLGLLWFGTWKNGISPYAPAWVLNNVARFKRVKNDQNQNTMTLSPFCEATLKADLKAYTALINFIRDNDYKENTVVAIQIENEVGVFGQSKDLCEAAKAKFNEQVPPILIQYMQQHKDLLEIELRTAWAQQGYRTTGNWQQVFGEGPTTDMFFMAWHYATYINTIAETGKVRYPLPTFVNCWMPATPQPNPRPNYTMPGKFPSGGPVIMVMDIWKAAAPHIDIVSPDLYGADFDLQTSYFHRYDNPLFIPETNAVKGRAIYVVGKHQAMGFSPFGIDDKYEQMSEEYALLKQLMPIIAPLQGSDKLVSVYKNNTDTASFSDVMFDSTTTIRIYLKRPFYRYNETIDSNAAAYAMFIKLSNDELMIAGKNVWVSAISKKTNKEVWLKDACRGRLINGVWKTEALHNGDEAGFLWSKKTPVYRISTQPTIVPEPDAKATIFKFKLITYPK